MMIEEIIYNYLKSAIAGVPVFLEIPEKAPAEFILITKTSSSRSNYIDSAMIAIKSYSTSLYKSAQLNETVKAKMYDSVSLGSIANCKLNSDYNYTDTTTKQYRYQAVFDVTYYND